jgi:hypothetical protein
MTDRTWKSVKEELDRLIHDDTAIDWIDINIDRLPATNCFYIHGTDSEGRVGIGSK